MTEATSATRLPQTFISVQGPDAEKLLQGQTSCDVSSLPSNYCSYGTTNTPKGRIYGLFRIIRWQDGFLLRLHNDIAENFIQQLGKYAMFFKCELKEEASFQAFGMKALPPGVETAPEKPNAVTKTSHGWLVRVPSNAPLFELWTDIEPELAVSDDATDWLIEETRAGLPELYPQTLEKFIVQHLNLDLLGAVSFTKGCYTGQEIIARMKYRGKLKKRMFLLSSDTVIETQAGEALYDESGKKCGELVRAHTANEMGTVGLGILDIGYEELQTPVFIEDKSAAGFSVSTVQYPQIQGESD